MTTTPHLTSGLLTAVQTVMAKLDELPPDLSLMLGGGAYVPFVEGEDLVGFLSFEETLGQWLFKPAAQRLPRFDDDDGDTAGQPAVITDPPFAPVIAAAADIPTGTLGLSSSMHVVTTADADTERADRPEGAAV